MLTTQKSEITDSHAKQNAFQCDKIDGACPYVDLINKNAVSALTKQLSNIDTQISKSDKQIGTYSSTVQKNKAEKDALNKELESLKTFLASIGRKDLQSNAKKYKDLQLELNELQSKQAKHIEKNRQLQAHKDEKISLATQLETL